METHDEWVLVWWAGLCCVAAFNLFLLFLTYRMLRKRMPDMGEELKKLRKMQFNLATIYTLGCGFRAILPRGDIRRIVLVDSWISCIAIGRSVATIAELSFVAQWCLMLWEAGKNTGNKTIRLLAKLPLPTIFVAEIFSWYACTTTNYIGTVVEESLWAVAATITVAGFWLARPYYQGAQRRFLNIAIIAGIGYILYMALVDVPAYVNGWLAAEEADKAYAGIREGMKQLVGEWHYTRAYSDWEYEMIWMSLYFSVAVWMSQLIVNAPRLDQGMVKENQQA